ncbi:unnamed protein product, partial [Ilex paraguariensis]
SLDLVRDESELFIANHSMDRLHPASVACSTSMEVGYLLMSALKTSPFDSALSISPSEDSHHLKRARL